MSQIDEAIQENRRDLDRRDKAISSDISKSWQDVSAKIEAQLLEIDLDDEWQRPRLESILKQTRAEAQRYATGTLKTTVERYTPLAQEHGVMQARQLTLLQVPEQAALTFNLTSPDGLSGSTSQMYSTLPVQAYENLYGTTTRGPLHNILTSFGPDIEQGMRQQLLQGMALGKNPREIARHMVRELGIAKDRADNISRSEIIRAYRESSRATYQANRHIIKDYVRVSALDDRTCLTCWALHGTHYSLDEPMESHPRCRCTMVPVTKTWAELGYPGIAETHYTTPSGEALFKKLDPETQMNILGPDAYKAYASGSVKITDFVGRTYSPEWGTTIHRLPNSQVIDP